MEGKKGESGQNHFHYSHSVFKTVWVAVWCWVVEALMNKF